MSGVNTLSPKSSLLNSLPLLCWLIAIAVSDITAEVINNHSNFLLNKLKLMIYIPSTCKCSSSQASLYQIWFWLKLGHFFFNKACLIQNSYSKPSNFQLVPRHFPFNNRYGSNSGLSESLIVLNSAYLFWAACVSQQFF